MIGERAKQLNLVDGYLIGYRLYRVKNTNYPLIVRDKLSSNKINGLVAMRLDIQLIRKLDMFEGKNYSKTDLRNTIEKIKNSLKSDKITVLNTVVRKISSPVADAAVTRKLGTHG